MHRLERLEPVERLHALPLCRDRPAAPSLVRGDDDVDESLEEVALGGVARTPGELEFLVRLEVRAAARHREALLVPPIDGANVGV